MKRTLQAVLLLCTGAALLRVSLFSDICLRYVKEGLRPYLIATGLILLALGLIGAFRDGLPFAAKRNADDEPRNDGEHTHDGHTHDGHGHDHSQGPRIAWLLLLPALTLLFFAPPALGSYTAARDNAKVVEDYSRFAPLPAHDPVPLSLTEFIARVQQDDKRSLGGRTVLMSGFVTPGTNGTWDLTRLLVACCAADSQSLTVTVHGVRPPPADTWVKVTGTWHPQGALGTGSAALALDVATVRRIPQPPSPYLDRAPAGP
ncbi:TIGR03943 family protein [Streptomyces lunaelactis]|uniref:TIGR03943 family protein n=1 Tax=Streptomyces lunaelactis TaxID=1535768 RepID=A0A2R4SXF0_9ACTN|nr:TIGR03943 family protein [Streptomyces lunaelactis]AVZ71527.1 TIGR03943 family protein [Streptomyces lunaelactis]NUK84906.1 TIGR03943 family protein [Streptomyces lunaelactis]